MSVNKIKTPVTKLDRYAKIMMERRVLDIERGEIKEEFLAELEPGQALVGRYTVTTAEVERQRLMSINDARVALAAAGHSNQQITAILNTITVTGTARQFLVIYTPK